MGDRVIVLDQGRIGQFGKPDEVYDRPATPNVARFLNCYNVFDGALDGDAFASAYGRFPFGVRMAEREAGLRRSLRPADRQTDGFRLAGAGTRSTMSPANISARRSCISSKRNDGKVVEVEHHLSNGPPTTFTEGEAYDLSWTSGRWHSVWMSGRHDRHRTLASKPPPARQKTPDRAEAARRAPIC